VDLTVIWFTRAKYYD